MGGVIAAGAPQSAYAGAQMFKLGGNAVDAAVAAAFASFVAEMMVVNLGGGGYAMVYDQSGATAFDFFTGVPERGNPETYDFHRIDVDYGPTTQPFWIGRAAAGVPGVMAGLSTLAAERGTLSLETLMAPAIELAHEGFHVSDQFALVISMLHRIFSHTPDLQSMFSPHGHFVRPGEFIRFQRLARTLETLAKAGPDYFYKGPLAELIAADQHTNGGRITARDLAEYEVHETIPLRIRYRNHEVFVPPPSSMGGMLIGFALKLLESVPLRQVAHNSTRHIAILAHVMRQANRAREAWDHVPISLDRGNVFLSDHFMAPYQQHLHELLAGAFPGDEPQAPLGGGNTSHISAIDNSGLAVGITTTAGENGGFTIAETGLCLNNILGELDLNPKGFHVQRPGDRMMSMMAPVIVCRDGHPVLSLGSAGSNRIRSATLQTISNVIDFDMTPDQAIQMPRVHHESGFLQLEGGIDPSVVEPLIALGFKANLWDDRSLYFGGVQAVAARHAHLAGAGDPRRGGGAMTVP